ncbi:ATP-binding protein, partial [Streptomyces bobili]
MPEITPTPSCSWEYSLSLPNDLRAVPISRRTLRLI